MRPIESLVNGGKSKSGPTEFLAACSIGTRRVLMQGNAIDKTFDKLWKPFAAPESLAEGIRRVCAALRNNFRTRDLQNLPPAGGTICIRSSMALEQVFVPNLPVLY